MYILKKQQRTSSKPMFLTQSRLNSINFNEDKILKVIRALNIHMAHSHDDIFNLFTFTIIFNKIYNFLLEEKLLNPNQSGFRPSNSCINQLLVITHEIFEAFDCNPSLEVRSVFLDISKAFDKVWHEGLLYKHKSMDVSGELYNLIENYLYLLGRFQRVALNGQTSSWKTVLAGVPQKIIIV